MENQLFNLLLKTGNILIFRNEDRISLQFNYENGDHCFLAPTDTQDLIQLLTMLCQHLWEDKNYKKTPYIKQLFVENKNAFSWGIDSSELTIERSKLGNGIVLKHQGDNPLNLEVNQVVEIVQILERLNI